MLLIGLVGKKRSGKDSFLAAITKDFKELDIYNTAFATPLKDQLFEFFLKNIGVERNVLDTSDSIIKERYRQLLQWYGTYKKEVEGSSYWIDQIKEEIQKNNHADIIVVTDVRFLNEAKMITELGGTLVRVVRPGNTAIDSHISEIELDLIECQNTIYNDSTLEDYAEKCEILTEALLGW